MATYQTKEYKYKIVDVATTKQILEIELSRMMSELQQVAFILENVI